MFSKIAKLITQGTGHPIASILALLFVLGWIISGPFYDFSDTWELVINTITSITTFLMVFLLQNSQNRETKAIQIKLDELLRAHQGAHTDLIDIESLSDEEVEALHVRYEKLKLNVKPGDEGTPDV